MLVINMIPHHSGAWFWEHPVAVLGIHRGYSHPKCGWMMLSCQKEQVIPRGRLALCTALNTSTLLPLTRTSSSLLIKPLLSIIQKSTSCLICDSQSNHLNSTNVSSAGRSRCSGGKQVEGNRAGSLKTAVKVGAEKNHEFPQMCQLIEAPCFSRHNNHQRPLSPKKIKPAKVASAAIPGVLIFPRKPHRAERLLSRQQ